MREAHQKTNNLIYFCAKYSSDDKNALIIHARSVNHWFGGGANGVHQKGLDR